MTDRLDAHCTSGHSPPIHLDGPPTGPVFLVLGGISADPALLWWRDLVGPGAPIDPRHHRVLTLGWQDAPAADTKTQARRVLAALDAHGIARVDAAIGCSYGGMVCLALAACAPQRVRRLVLIGAAHRQHALARAWRFVQRELAGQGPDGLALARALAMATYRSDRELDARFGGDPDALEAWLRHHGSRFSARFDARAFLDLADALDRHDVAPERVGVPTTVVGFDTDQLVPPWLLDELCERLPRVRRVHIESPYGHDAFLKESAALAPVLRRSLAQEVAA